MDSQTGREMFARKSGDLAGIIIPYLVPGEGRVVEYRLRVDHPDLEYRADGTLRETRKYIHPPGRPNRLYFPPGLTPEVLADPSTPVIITEGEFKALALRGISEHQTNALRFLPVSIAGSLPVRRSEKCRFTFSNDCDRMKALIVFPRNSAKKRQKSAARRRTSRRECLWRWNRAPQGAIPAGFCSINV